jgi:hypothetical protein
MKNLLAFWHDTLGSVRDLAPIIVVIGFFQFVVLRQPVDNAAALLGGVIFVVLGLTFFVYGLKLALFPLGEALAYSLARKGSAVWLLTFAFVLGFGTTFAEPAVIAVAAEAAQVAALEGIVADSQEGRDGYVLGLRITIAMAVGTGITLGVLRLLLGWSLPLMFATGYGLVVLVTLVAPAHIVAIAYDSGGVTTSTVTVPLVAALGIGLASSLSNRNPMTDGFGLIAFASLTPILFVLVFGMYVSWT